MKTRVKREEMITLHKTLEADSCTAFLRADLEGAVVKDSEGARIGKEKSAEFAKIAIL